MAVEDLEGVTADGGAVPRAGVPAAAVGQKAKNGGTVGLAPIGYENVRIKFEGREIRTVALPLAKIERKVIDHYVTAHLRDDHRAHLAALAEEACADAHEATTTLRAGLRKELIDVDREEDRYLDLLGDPDWPQAKIKTRLRDVRERKTRVAHQLETTTSDLAPARAL